MASLAAKCLRHSQQPPVVLRAGSLNQRGDGIDVTATRIGQAAAGHPARLLFRQR
ncbi:MAG: hypothetical protein NVS3B14_03280 [Ktedonobacteraceae bacterium]